VKVAGEIPANAGSAIRYPVTVLTTSKEPVAAKKFVPYLESKPALAVFPKYGFLVAR